ncbi:hypothetical protein [Amycolatopsis nalaikhensis]|uniref:Secreted protein n=1 Tax=Amycolatopsis nalaikhensis TaxID=715472 RepID=A0ABY8XCR2_9PSEU|nr:hypothetical protein [Amycolatopsis sp. 2-2]WIV52935.1 hypothetical protein QP939_28775 [Amycolatopsis sp. 2-2]
MSISLVQSALISAGTAAAVTMLVEYAAKPRLEARKDRVVERMRFRRQMEARLLSLPHDLKYLYGLELANIVWFMGAQNLDDMSEECGQLYVEFGKFSDGLPKRQRDVVGGYLLQLSSTLIALQYNVFLYKETGIIGQLIRDKQVQKVGTADHIHMMVDTVYECVAGAYSALVLSPARPIRFVERLRKLAQHQKRLAAKFTNGDPDSGDAEATASTADPRVSSSD